MTTISTKRTLGSVVTALLLVAATAGTAQAERPDDRSGMLGVGAALATGSPPSLEALNARSATPKSSMASAAPAERRTLGTPGDGWRDALEARSAAMNRHYGLGTYARQGAARSASPDWLTALVARSDALNRAYGLGTYARTTDDR